MCPVALQPSHDGRTSESRDETMVQAKQMQHTSTTEHHGKAEQDSLQTVEMVGPTDFALPADMCVSNISFPPELLVTDDQGAACEESSKRECDLEFCLPTLVSCDTNNGETSWPVLSAAVPSEGTAKKYISKSKRQQKFRQEQHKSLGASRSKSPPAPLTKAGRVDGSSSDNLPHDTSNVPNVPPSSSTVAAMTGQNSVRSPPGLSGPDLQSALLRASFLGRTDIVRLCLQRGANPLAADSVGRMPLHYAAATGVVDAVKLILEYTEAADKATRSKRGGKKDSKAIDRADYKRWTPLLISVTKEHVPCVQLLLEHGADTRNVLCHRCAPCRGDPQPETASAAAEQEGLEVSEQAVEVATAVSKEGSSSGTTTESTLQTWSSAIHFAAIKGNVEISELLLLHGSSVNELDSDLRPPLHYAACRDKPDYVRWLIEKGARIDLLDVNNRSAFHAVAIRGLLQIAQMLIEATPPHLLLNLLRQPDRWGLTAAKLSKLHGHTSLHLLLKSYQEALEAEGQGSVATFATGAATSKEEAAMNSTIAEVLATGLQEVKRSKLDRTVQRLGTLVCLKAYQQTLMIQALGGMLVADGSRRKTAGGVFFTVLNELAKSGEISREDLAYINAEDDEVRKATRRRARQTPESLLRHLNRSQQKKNCSSAGVVGGSTPLSKPMQPQPRRVEKRGLLQRQQRENGSDSQPILRRPAQVETMGSGGEGEAFGSTASSSYSSLAAAIANDSVHSAGSSPSSAIQQQQRHALVGPAFPYALYPFSAYWPMAYPGAFTPGPSLRQGWSSSATQQGVQHPPVTIPSVNLTLQQAVAAAQVQQQQQQLLQHAAGSSISTISGRQQPMRRQQQKLNSGQRCRTEGCSDVSGVADTSSRKEGKPYSYAAAVASVPVAAGQREAFHDTATLLQQIKKQEEEIKEQRKLLVQLRKQKGERSVGRGPSAGGGGGGGKVKTVATHK